MKVKIIRTLPELMEEEMQKFIDSVGDKGLVSITLGGQWEGKGLAVVMVTYYA